MIEARGTDAFFLWQESRRRHMHTLKIVIVDPSTAHRELTFEGVRESAGIAMPHALAFRRRPVRVPLSAGHPAWLDAPQLDRGYHFRHAVLPEGAGEAELEALANEVVSEPLDPHKPLWQLVFVEGLPGGRVAFLLKLHHAVADGAASARLATQAFAATPDPTRLPPPVTTPNEPAPSLARLVAFTLGKDLARQHELPGLLRRSLAGIRVGRRFRREGKPLQARPFSGPMTRFNRPLTAQRGYTNLTLSLGELQEVKEALGCTVNDVYLTLVGGALRHYLEKHGELPAQALTAAIPVSVRNDTDDPAFGNATNSWFTSTGSDVADPVERLAVVSAGTRAARELFAAREPRLAVDWLEHWPWRRLYLATFQALAAAFVRRPSFNVIVSNVHGPRMPLYADGGKVVALRSMGPLAPQQGLNFTAWSYVDDFAIGIHACREHVPDIHVLTKSFGPELESLKRAAAEARKTPGSPRVGAA
ncbi:MAG: wax ester/triacylglycerol synthase family O-acyltransferase [Myxococcales bacterium]|nr:wax ester/triacylglycerol synthase family O-acyltransferase [Myxococcales bacterium]